jgi:hypothetical protein
MGDFAAPSQPSYDSAPRAPIGQSPRVSPPISLPPSRAISPPQQPPGRDWGWGEASLFAPPVAAPRPISPVSIQVPRQPSPISQPPRVPMPPFATAPQPQAPVQAPPQQPPRPISPPLASPPLASPAEELMLDVFLTSLVKPRTTFLLSCPSVTDVSS